ncbi:MAG: hypothetical protein AAF226_02270 [Verrucomicrobiota bacterium]
MDLLKTTCIIFALVITLVSSGFSQNTARIHDGFHLPVPKTNFVILSEHAFHPDNHVIIDLNNSTVSIYSPYRNDAPLLVRMLTKAEIREAKSIFLPYSFMLLKGDGGVSDPDAPVLTVRANISNKKRMTEWGNTTTGAAKRMQQLYNHLRKVPRRD